jgi:hypothetical protein
MPELSRDAGQATHYGRPGGTRQRCWKSVTVATRLRAERRAGVLRMIERSAVVQIIGAPLACAEGVKDTWREVSKYTADQLIARFGESVRVRYFDLFDPDCPTLPDGAQLPLVLIEGEVLSTGGKVSVPAIRKRLEALGCGRDDH